MANNMQVARSVFEELFSKGKLDMIDQIFDPSYKGHETLIGEFDRAQLKRNVQMYRTGFPDLTVSVNEAVEAGEKVLARWTARGTNSGTFMNQPPTGKQSKVDGITVATFRNGKIVEDWTQWDVLGMLRQLGMAPQMAASGAQPAAPR
jgi:steroid delta-isomerase-like uncharacterized protein